MTFQPAAASIRRYASMTWGWASRLVRSTVRSNWAACWSELTTAWTVDSRGMPRLPMMSDGGSLLLTMACSLSTAGTRLTVVPSSRVTCRMVKVGFVLLEKAAAATPPRRMTTARPRTIRAGPLIDIGSYDGEGVPSSAPGPWGPDPPGPPGPSGLSAPGDGTAGDVVTIPASYRGTRPKPLRPCRPQADGCPG